ncbi:MAG: ATP phosphoribosyltransferase [Candidatus Thermoplasmatota archaeon]|nr:ATP phosphoribosyltransferase [Candidatus Thermoplasmatota archaeon]
MIKIAVPNKGRLSEESIRLLRSIGLKIALEERSLFLETPKYSIIFVRAQDIPGFVEEGVADIGITGLDLVLETGKKVKKLLELNFGYCRLAIAVPEKSKILAVEDIPNNAKVATSFPNLTKEYFRKIGKKIDIVEVSGTAEIAPHLGVAELITDLVETGATLKTNYLREIGTITESKAVAIANEKALELEEKKRKINELVAALASVINATGRRYLMANVPKEALEDVKSLIPGISGPTVMSIIGSEKIVAVHAVVNEEEINGVIAVLKKLGATGILIVPIERAVL